MNFYLQYTNGPLQSETALLGLLRHYFSEVPCDTRTLLEMPKICSEKVVDTGVYVHLGLAEGLMKQLHRVFIESLKEAMMSLEIDCLRVFNNWKT